MPMSRADQAFWLQVMEEHALFIFDHLSPREVPAIRQAQQFIQAYAELRRRAQNGSDPLPTQFAQEALQVSRAFMDYKLALMRARINNDIVLNLTPAFFNGIISELEEYIRLLTPLAVGEEPAPVSAFHDLFLWLPDQLGHASLMVKDLDLVERALSRETNQYVETFTGQYLSAIQLSGYARALGPRFPKLDQLVEEIAGTTQGFYKVVKQALELYRTDRLMNRATAVFLEHHFEESKYFLRKLGEQFPELAVSRPQLFLPPR